MLILTTGGTIDKLYFDENSKYEVGESTLPTIFEEVGVHFAYKIKQLMRKDSLDLTLADRNVIKTECLRTERDQILITHGTDTLCQSAQFLQSVPDKTIVLTGALSPACFRQTDAIFNIGVAIGAVQSMPHGVYVCMHGKIFIAGKVQKNTENRRFEALV